MRTLLDLEAGTDFLTPAAIAAAYQPLDADLTIWAGLTPSANAQSLVTAANYAAMRTLLDLEAGTDFLTPAAIAAAYQPLDADLTIWAGLTPSANAQSLVTAANYAAMRTLLDLEAGTDFVALTGGTFSGPVVTTSTVSTTYALRALNTNNSSTAYALSIEGDRSSPTNGDTVFANWVLSNSSGTQTLFGAISCVGTTVTAASETGTLSFGTRSSGAYGERLLLNATELRANSDNVISLGLTNVGFSDLFLGNGAVIGFNNGDVSITHSSNSLAFTGGSTGYTFDAPVSTTSTLKGRTPRSSETTGTLTAASANTVVACSGGITLDDGVFTADDVIAFDPGTSARTFTRASGLTMYVNGTDSASATLAANQMGGAYWRSSSVVVLSGAFT
jgi:hypothetical protein